MQPQSRRDFLQLCLYSLASAHLAGCGILPRASERRAPGKGKILLPTFNSGVVRIYDWDRRTFSELAVPLKFTHSALQNPRSRNEVLVFDNTGPGCAVIDIESKRVKTALDLAGGRAFYGHGVMTADGEHVICTEYIHGREDYSSGFLSIRKSSTLEKVGELSSYGVHPHDVCFLDSDTLAVTNHGESDVGILGNVSFVSLKSGALLRKVEQEPSFGHFGHLHRYDAESVFVASVLGDAPKNPETEKLRAQLKRGGAAKEAAEAKLKKLIQYQPSPMYLVGKDGRRERAWDEADKNSFKNNFSICTISEKEKSFASANGGADSVVIWQQTQVRKILKFEGMYPSAVAVSADGSELVVGAANGTVKFLSTADFSEVPGTTLKLANGPVHILSLT